MVYYVLVLSIGGLRNYVDVFKKIIRLSNFRRGLYLIYLLVYQRCFFFKKSVSICFNLNFIFICLFIKYFDCY